MNEEERKRIIEVAQNFFNKHQLTMECNIEAKEFQAFYHILLDYQKLQKENENKKENYKNLILNVSKIAIELGLEEDGTIDEIYAKIREKDKQIKDLQLRKNSQEKRFKKYKENIEKKHEEIYENLVAENEEKDKIIKLFEHECRKFKAFCRKVRKDGHDIDLFNQGQEHKCNQFLNLINGESHWDYEGKYFDETDKEIQKLAKEKKLKN